MKCKLASLAGIPYRITQVNAGLYVRCAGLRRLWYTFQNSFVRIFHLLLSDCLSSGVSGVINGNRHYPDSDCTEQITETFDYFIASCLKLSLSHTLATYTPTLHSFMKILFFLVLFSSTSVVPELFHRAP